MPKKIEGSAAIVAFLLLFAFGVRAESEGEPAAAAAAAEAEAPEEGPSEEELAAAAAAEEAEQLEESLRGILSAQKLVAEDLRARQSELESEAAVGREEEITAEIKLWVVREGAVEHGDEGGAGLAAEPGESAAEPDTDADE